MCYSQAGFPSCCSFPGGRVPIINFRGARQNMRIRVAISVFCLMIVAALPAQAQYAARGTSDRATGENYHFEFGGYFWNPTPTIFITSEGLTEAQLGTKIDFVEDLGIEKTRFTQIKAVLRPGKKHKFRFEYTPISYDQPNGVLRRNIVF